MSCIPTGRPSEKPQGTDRPGSPAMFTGRVQTSIRYICTGSSVFSPNLNAVTGEVGVTSASTSWNTRSKSCLISVRACWALRADFCGAALWLPPGVHPDDEALKKVFRDTAKHEHLDDLLATFEKMDEWNPDEPHWYLPLVGVEPNAQGRGLGGALMRHAVARCDQEDAVAYLESSNPRNISLYERHGFEVMGEIQVGLAPPVTPMLRQPR